MQQAPREVPDLRALIVKISGMAARDDKLTSSQRRDIAVVYISTLVKMQRCTELGIA